MMGMVEHEYNKYGKVKNEKDEHEKIKEKGYMQFI